jgi:hypothetical protein
MTLNELTYDIIMILTKLGFTNDSRLEESYIEYLIHKKRGSLIVEDFKNTGIIHPVFFQDLGMCDLTIINPSEDRNISICNCPIAKVTLPRVIGLYDDISMQFNNGVRVSSVCNTKKYFPIAFDLFSQIPEHHERMKMKQFFQIGDAFYLSPVVKKARFIAVLSNPKEGFVIQSENVANTDLIIGQTYYVVDKQIVHNGVPYAAGASFVAVTTTYSGNGTVQFYNQKRAITEFDEYPITAEMANRVILNVLTEEFKLESSQLADVVQDSRDSNQLISK